MGWQGRMIFGWSRTAPSATSFDAQDTLQEKQLRRFNQATLRAFEEHVALDATEANKISDNWLFCEDFQDKRFLKVLQNNQVIEVIEAGPDVWSNEKLGLTERTWLDLWCDGKSKVTKVWRFGWSVS